MVKFPVKSLLESQADNTTRAIWFNHPFLTDLIVKRFVRQDFPCQERHTEAKPGNEFCVCIQHEGEVKSFRVMDILTF